MEQLMERRDFLKMAAMAAGTAALSGVSCAAENVSLKGRIKKAVGLGMLKMSGGPAEKLKVLKELGFDGVEVGPGEVDPEVLNKAAEETGMKAHGVVNGWSLDDIPKSIDYACAIGADSVLIVPGKVEDGVFYDELYARSQKIYRETAIPYAAEKKMPLLVENVWNNFLLSPLEMARFVDELDSPWLAAYFDVGNILRYGWSEQWIRVLGKRIKKIHIKDYSKKIMEEKGLWPGFDVNIGEGSANWGAVRQELAAIDFNGWATAEVGGGGKERLAQISKEMDTVLGL